MAATIKIPATFTAVDKFSHVIGKMANSTTKFASSGMSAIKRFDTRVSNSFKKLGKLSQLALGVGLGALFLNAAQGVATYEEGLVGVSKTTGIEGKALQSFSKDVQLTSKHLRGISSVKLLQLGQSAGQLGVTGPKNILAFSSTLAKLEKASDIQGEQGAAQIARLLTITGEGVGKVDRFAASLVGLGNTSAATESEILGVASEVARSTAAYKLQSTQILGIATALKSLDVNPEAGGTAVGKVMRGIENATIKGGKTLEAYSKVMGLSALETKSLFASDSQAAFSMLIKGLNRIGNEGGSVQKALGSLGLTGETVSKGIVPLATNYSLLEDKLKVANQGFMQNLALNKEFDAATKTTNTALQEIRDEFQNVFIKTATAGSGLERFQNLLFFVADHMETIVVAGGSVIGMFGLMKAIVWGSQAAMVAYNIALGVQGALSGAASIAIGKNAVALGAYRVAMALGTAGTWLATAATTAFGVAMNLGLWPITLIVGAIAGLIALFYNWDSVTAWFGEQWQKFTSWISGLWDNVVGWFQKFDFKAFFKNIGQSILKFMLAPMQTILTLLSKIELFGIGEMASNALDKISGLTGEDEIMGNSNKPITPPEIRQIESNERLRETIQQNRITMDINDPGGHVGNVSNEGPEPIAVRTRRTMGRGQ